MVVNGYEWKKSKNCYMLSNKKIYVGKHSKEIQEKAFELGWTWSNKSKKIWNTSIPFLFFNNDKVIAISNNIETFNEHRYEEITFEDLMSYKGYKKITDGYVPSGQLKDFPIEVVKKIVEYQVKQGNVEDVSVFEDRRTRFKKDGGFDWGETPEGERFWVAVLGYKHFERFFELYAENKVVSQPPFKPFEKVLVRNGENSKWKIDFFSHIDKEESFKFICLSNQYKYCVPFRGNEHLLNTNANVESQQ